MLANKIGTFVKVDKSNDIEIDRDLRIRVIIDVRTPVKDEVKLQVHGGEQIKVPVKYERLPLICFICGKLGHGDRDCDLQNNDSSPIKKFGTWIRASPWKTNVNEERNEAGNEGKIKQWLFITKPDKSGPLSNDMVKGVVEKLESVAISKEQQVEENALIPEDKRLHKEEKGGGRSKWGWQSGI
ncbi:Avenin-like b8 [Bienertia sinuspersici]